MVLDKKELDRSIHLLEGILKGVAFDQEINTQEIDELHHWIKYHEDYGKHYPYTVLIPLLSTALADRVITEEEKQDILWFCNKVSTENFFYDLVFSDLQRLQGILHGILSDKIIRDEEILSLEEWLNDKVHLKSYYPYDELVSIIDDILEDQIITEQERKLLERYCIEFVNKDLLSAYTEEDIQSLKSKMTISAICATDPTIDFHKKTFAITGQITKGEKKRLIDKLTEKGGQYSHKISDKVNYLIIMDTSALLWAFEPFGRKIDQALKLRLSGIPLVIVSKKDFLKALS